jgi:hypothetical protein
MKILSRRSTVSEGRTENVEHGGAMIADLKTVVPGIEIGGKAT